MCGRFAGPVALLSKYESDPRYNIAPSSYVWVINRNGPVQYKWGLVPGWVKDIQQSYNLINLRDDTLVDKRKFQGNYKSKRCLVPVSGFYEWKKGTKEPYFFYKDSKEDFCLAGLWDHWQDRGEELNTFTVITTASNLLMKPVHHRMPVILQEKDYDRWLNPGNVDDLLKSASENFLNYHQVSTYVNKPTNEGIKCTNPLQPGA